MRNDRKSAAGSISMYALYVALAFIFGYLEAVLPINLPVPGAKPGLSNIVIVYVLYMSGSIRHTYVVMLLKVVLTGFTFGNPSMMLYSFCGGFLSVSVMYLLYKTGHFSTYGVSIAGGAFHNIGQVICACIMFNTFGIIYYMPVLIVTGMLTGLFVGFFANICIKRMIKFTNNNN